MADEQRQKGEIESKFKRWTAARKLMEQGLKTRAVDPLQAELDQAKKRIGELLMRNELLDAKAKRAPNFRMGRFEP